MHRRKSLQHLALAAAFLAGATAAEANEIKFEDAYSATWEFIAADYGSIVNELDTLLETNTGGQLQFWPSGYSNRPAAFSGNDSVGHITLTPLNGLRITLDSFFLGGYLNAGKVVAYRIDNLDTPGLDVDAPDALVDANTGLTVTPAMSSFAGIRISFGPDGYNGGINNIQYTLAAVPEPGTWAMLSAGLGLLGLLGARRRV
jgi:hypothetical protein